MLNTSNIILISIISLLILFFAFGGKPNQVIEKYPEIKAKPLQRYKYNKNIQVDVDQELLEDVVSWGSNDSGNVRKEVINSNFVDIQYHKDYAHVIDAISALVVAKRQLFNLANIPIKYSVVNPDEVKLLITDFINVLNKSIGEETTQYRNAGTGWSEQLPEFTGEDAFGKSQIALGLAPSLYDKPAGKSPVRVISIEKVQKYETEDEIKYAIEMIIQKANSDDQMALKGSFVQDKRPLQDENNFFVSKNIDMKVVIEDVYILGFYSKDGPITAQQYDMDKEKFYFYDKMEANNLTDPKHIQKILMDKYKQRTEDMDHRNAMLDEEGQDYHRKLPTVYDYSNIMGTRTIFDDMNEKKVFY